jgi:hypothetical protein
MGNWIKISKKSGSYIRGILYNIDTIHKCAYLHSDKVKRVRFKDIKKIQFISISVHLPKFYKKRLRRMGVRLKPKVIVKKEGQMKFEVREQHGRTNKKA